MADLSLMQSEYLVADAVETQREERFQELNNALLGNSADEAMPPLQRVEKYSKSDQPFDRQMVPRVMQAAFRSAPPDQLAKDLPHLMQIICKIADEDEVTVRSDLLEQIPNLAETGVECSARCPALATLVADHLLPLVVRHLTTVEYHVLKVAQHALLALMERALVTKVQAEIQVCPTILSLSRREQEKELGMDFQSSSVTLMSKMAPLLGRDVMERVFLERFAELCANATFNIRKVCATHLSDFAAVVGREAYENVLLPSYLSLCSDENWSVRKACAEAAVGVSCVCPTSSLRHCTLAPLYTRLLRDSSRWVRSAAFQGLGPFISTFAQQPGGVTTLSYNAQGDLVLMNKYGCEFELHSITPAIEDMKHFVNMSVISDEPELDFGDGYNIPSLTNHHFSAPNQPSTSSSPSTAAASDDVDSDSDDGGQSILDIDEQLNTLCVYNRAVKMAESNSVAAYDGARRMRLVGGRDAAFVDWGVRQDASTSMFRFKELQYGAQEELSSDNAIESKSSEVPNNLEPSQQNRESSSTNFAAGSKKEARLDYVLGINTHGAARRDYLAALRSSGDGNSLLSADSGHKIILFKDMPLDPDIVDAGVSLVTLPAPQPIAMMMAAAVAPDVVPQREPLASPSMNNLNDESINSSNSSLLRNNGGNNICDLLSTTLNVINTESNDNNTNRLSLNENSSLPTQSTETETINLDYFKLLLDDQPSLQLNATFTVTQPTISEGDECEESSTCSAVVADPPQRIVPQQLIDHFTSMTQRQLEENTNPDIAYYCAYSLPAVALTLGSENWHLLQGTVESLAQHAYYKVRLTVASCLHELAVILGQEIASEYLTIIFDGFIKDLDEVRIGILKHMAHFLILISPVKRRHYLGLFVEFLRIDNQLNWRFQLQLAIQLRLAVPLFRPIDVLRHIFSIGLVLLHHGVAVARRTAIMLVTEVFKYCNKKKKTTSNLLVKVAETLAHATLWKLRQTFALLAAELVRQEALPSPVFAVEVLPHLLDLSWDPVAVVRLSVGRTIATHIITKDYYKDPANQHYDTLQTVLRRLQSDKDRDVRDFSSLVSSDNK